MWSKINLGALIQDGADNQNSRGKRSIKLKHLTKFGQPRFPSLPWSLTRRQKLLKTFRNETVSTGLYHFQEVLKWKESRQFFYWRLKRILMTRDAKRKFRHANP